MSSAAYLTWDQDEGVTLDQWEAFCDANNIKFRPRTGSNVFYQGQVEITFGELPRLPNGKWDLNTTEPPAYAERITFSTYHMGEAMPQVAELAWRLWLEHGGMLQADVEIRHQLKPRSR